MRSITLLAALVLVSGFVLTMSPVTSARPLPVCVGGTTCPDSVCVDANLNGKFEGIECVGFVCPQYGCCYCPPPQWL